jgi:hypothetical protein
MKKLNPNKALAGAVDWGIFIIASVMLYAKTSEVFARFAPVSFFSFTEVGFFYGMICALLVEGVLVLCKLSIKYSENSNAFLWNVLLISFAWGISAAAQIFDGFLTADTLETAPPIIQVTLTYGIPLIPSMILAAVLVKSIVAAMPEETAKPAVKTAKQNKPNVPQLATKVYAAETANGMFQEGNQARTPGEAVRKNELTAAEKDKITRMNTRQIMANFYVEPRTARDWKNKAKRGEL